MRASSVLVVLALLALVALAAAVPQHKLQSRGANKHAAAAKHAAPQDDVMLESEESTEIVNSLKQLLEQKKVRHEGTATAPRRRHDVSEADSSSAAFDRFACCV